MDRFSTSATFPVLAGLMAGAGALVAAAALLGGFWASAIVAATFGLAVFAVALSLRNWRLGETERPLLAEELTGLHDRLDIMQSDAEDMRELLTELAVIVEETAAGDVAALEARPAPPAADRAAQLEALDARTRKLALAVEALLKSHATSPDKKSPPGSSVDNAVAVETSSASLADDRASAKDLPTLSAPSTPHTDRRVAGPKTPAPNFGADDVPGLEMMLQAVFSFPGGEPRYFEAFTRRTLPDGGIAPQADHIDVAKASGDIGLVDMALVRKCLAAAAQFRDADRDVAVFCNISVEPLRQPATLRTFIALLRRHMALSRHVVFEFSQLEIDALTDPDVAILQQLRETGFAFSIDHLADWTIDIGQLAKLGFHFVKLDAPTLLSREHASPGALRRLSAGMARSGLTLIAEKIETAEEARALREAGAVLLQGDALARPHPVQLDAEVGAPEAPDGGSETGAPIDEPRREEEHDDAAAIKGPEGRRSTAGGAPARASQSAAGFGGATLDASGASKSWSLSVGGVSRFLD